MTLPLPSSPHCAPTNTVLAINSRQKTSRARKRQRRTPRDIKSPILHRKRKHEAPPRPEKFHRKDTKDRKSENKIRPLVFGLGAVISRSTASTPSTCSPHTPSLPEKKTPPDPSIRRRKIYRTRSLSGLWPLLIPSRNLWLRLV